MPGGGPLPGAAVPDGEVDTPAPAAGAEPPTYAAGAAQPPPPSPAGGRAGWEPVRPPWLPPEAPADPRSDVSRRPEGAGPWSAVPPARPARDPWAEDTERRTPEPERPAPAEGSARRAPEPERLAADEGTERRVPGPVRPAPAEGSARRVPEPGRSAAAEGTERRVPGPVRPAPAEGSARRAPEPGRSAADGGGAAPAEERAGADEPVSLGGRSGVGHVGGGPPTYEPEPTALPAADALELDRLVADTVIDGARYGTYTLRAASVRGDSARFRGEPRSDALLTARFGTGPDALVLVAVAGGSRHTEYAHLAAGDACRWIGTAVGRSHARLADDIRAGRRGDLRSGLHRLTDRSLGRLRARAAELGVAPEEYTAGLRCLLLSADPECRTRVFFGVGPGGLFRLRDGAWQDLEPLVPERAPGEPVVGYGSAPPEAGPDGDRLTMDLSIATRPPVIEEPVPPPADPFRFRASVARPGDTLLLCGTGLAEPLRGEPALAGELAARWHGQDPPGMTAFLADVQVRVKGYADDRTAVGVWEA
ncbi:protein phosphatase 2C domain-containing protein [Streptomyces zhihengii]|uniref:protein phosphatase 2C domain-containing protein n=1 Tax=Streptomyces zhihengii TaxID=1818004 RepID=UPI003684029A